MGRASPGARQAVPRRVALVVSAGHGGAALGGGPRAPRPRAAHARHARLAPAVHCLLNKGFKTDAQIITFTMVFYGFMVH